MWVTLTVNGEPVRRDVEPRLLLVHFLRDDLGLTGTHWGCDTSNCGACAVWLDGEPVKSCTVLTVMADGHDVRTVEGLETPDGLDVVQRAFLTTHGVQCGFCTPGMLMTARALLNRNPDPSDADIREAISGQVCRCTGYASIVRAIRWAADEQRRTHAAADEDQRHTPAATDEDQRRTPAATDEDQRRTRAATEEDQP